MHRPERRSRNIGTSRQGHGQNNRLQIPESWRDMHIYYEKLQNPVIVKRFVCDKEYVFLIEPTLIDYTHSCTVDDIERMISLLPSDDVQNVDLIVLRQPTRKQKILSSVWGRLAFFYETEHYSGTAIVLEAQKVDEPLEWSKSVNPERKRELQRLERDGHQIRTDSRKMIIHTNLECCRNTQLYRTIPHEIGHYVDYLNDEDAFDSKTSKDKEDFAHRYADEFNVKMKKSGKLPFKRIFDEEKIKADDLCVDWFT